MVKCMWCFTPKPCEEKVKWRKGNIFICDKHYQTVLQFNPQAKEFYTEVKYCLICNEPLDTADPQYCSICSQEP